MMSQTLETPCVQNEPTVFVDRRNPTVSDGMPMCERRQFANSYEELSPDAAELGRAIDQFKLMHRRRFINFEEMLGVIKSLGYQR